MQDHHYSCLALVSVSFSLYEARVTCRWQRATGILLSALLGWYSVLRSLHSGTAASRGCCLLTEPAVLLAQLSSSCWAWALGLCESLGMFIWFPSLVPTPQTLARLLCHQGLCSVTGNWGKFNCFLLSLFPMQLNKRFILSFLHAHGKLFTRIG